MTLIQLLRRNLVFHRRGNLAVLLGVAVGTAVLTGALLVGDSLRGSLRDRAERRLGGVDAAMVAGRFISATTANAIEPNHGAVLLRASAESSSGVRVSGVTVWGIASGSPRMPFQHDVADGEVWLSPSIAGPLGVGVGDRITLGLSRQSAVARESLFGRKSAEESVDRVAVTVAGILPAKDPAVDFSLVPGVAPPRNAYVRLPWLQTRLDLADRVNVVVSAGKAVKSLNESMQKAVTLDDWGLAVRHPTERADTVFGILDRDKDGTLRPGEWRNRVAEATILAADIDRDRNLTGKELRDYYQRRGHIDLESKSLLLEPAVERTALDVAKEMSLKAEPTLVYLANSIGDGKRSIPYSVVAARNDEGLSNDEIVLVDWPQSPLAVKSGDPITLTYFEPEQEGRFKESTATFRLRGFVPLSAADPDLTPEFPGITDKLGLRDWDPPFPYDNSRVKKPDEDYWTQYRGSPKAFVSLAAGRKLFGSRFGDATSVRLIPPAGSNLDAAAKEFAGRLLQRLDPAAGGFVFEDVRARALAASTGGQDFGMLFLGFSFFLIAAALMLVGLIVRLNLDRRASEIGLLMATGFRVRTVRRLHLAEAIVVAVSGAIIGLAGAVAYAGLMLKLLATLWPSGDVGSFLTLHVTSRTLAIGLVAAVAASALTLWWAIRALGRVAPSALIAGGTLSDGEGVGPITPSRKRRLLLGSSLVLGVSAIVAGMFVRDHEAQAGSFFTGGMLLLTAALTGVWAWLKAPRSTPITPGSAWAIDRLGGRNAARNPTRSLLTAALLAAAAFLFVAVESFRRSPDAEFLDRNGGSGGYALVAELDLPIYQGPNAGPGRQELLDALERRYQTVPNSNPQTVKSKLDAATDLLQKTTIVPLRLRAGDDASCLNLYQPGKPRLLGVPRVMIERGGFHFAGVEARDTTNPWELLTRPVGDGAIPVFGEANTIQWVLKKGIGDTLEDRDEAGRPVTLRIVGTLKDSVFQGELLMSEENFLRLFPRQEGFSYLLADAPRGRETEVRDLLSSALASRGPEVTFAQEKLASYLAVENTYLSTFQVLGGFGLLLGALGLAVVLLRGVWERRGELALLKALGFRNRALGRMVLAENALLLVVGLGAGVGAALVSVAPHVLKGEGHVPWTRLAGMLALVAVCGLVSGALAVRATLRTALIPALRKE